jgi:hypothetical protein
MVYIPKKQGPVIPGINLPLVQIIEIVQKLRQGVTLRRIRYDYGISRYYVKQIEHRFG